MSEVRSGHLLFVEPREPVKGSYHKLCLCRCDCGNEVVKRLSDFNSGHKTCSRKCPLYLAVQAEKATKHGMKKHPMYQVWHAMWNRCTNKKAQAWKNYGGRGITVDERWNSFENFNADMGPTWVAGLELDREDNDAGYSPKNCRWVTAKQNCRNRRSSITPDWVLDEAERIGMGRTTLHWRRKRGMSWEQILYTPKHDRTWENPKS